MSKPEEILVLEQKLKVTFYEKQQNAPAGSVLPGSVVCEYRTDLQNQVIELIICGYGPFNLLLLRPFVRLQRLTLSGNKLPNLEPGLFYHTQLQELILSQNPIYDISILKKFEQLYKLDIAGTAVNDLSPVYKQLKSGRLKDLIYNEVNIQYPGQYPMEQIVPALERTWLEAKEKIHQCLKEKKDKLDIGNCGLTDLSYIPELFDCVQLKELILSNEWAVRKGGEFIPVTSVNIGFPNNIFDIPDEIQRLKGLRVLICGGDWRIGNGFGWNRWRIKDIKALRSLVNLTYLNVSNNLISRVGSLAKLKNLEQLHLNNNLIETFEHEKLLPNLKELFLSNNRLRNIAFLNNFPNLETVDLHSNRLKSLITVTQLIEKIGVSWTKWTSNTINVEGNPQIEPDQDIIADGTARVVAYFDQVRAEQQVKLPAYKNNEIKVVIAGNSYAGKSSLLTWLTQKKFDDTLTTTHWLDTVKYTFRYKGSEVKVRCFDFGGQDYYHDTHHLFFTSRTAYLVVWDGETNKFGEVEVEQVQRDKSLKNILLKTYPLEYWLEAIQFYTRKRQQTAEEKQVAQFIAGKKDEMKRQAGQDRLSTDSSDPGNILVIQNKVDLPSQARFLNEQALKKRFPMISDFFRASVKTQKGVTYLEELITELIVSCAMYDQRYPGSWGIVKEYIEKNQNAFPYELSLHDFKQQCNNRIKKIKAVRKAGVNRMQSVLFSDNDADSFARYLNDIGLILYYPADQRLAGKVFVNPRKAIDKIHRILEEIEPLNGEFDQELVVKTLALPNFDEDAQTLLELMENFKIIVRHPGQPGRYIAPLYLPKIPHNAVKLFLHSFKNPVFRYQFKSYIHKSIVLEFFQQFAPKLLTTTSGQDFYYYWRQGLVIKDPIGSEVILIKFVNGNPEDAGAYIDLYSLASTEGETFLREVIAEINKIIEDRDIIPMVKAPDGHYVRLSVILEAEKKERWRFSYEERVYDLNNFKYYLNKPIQLKKLFISYSKDDLALVNDFIDHLAALKLDGKIGSWYCSELVAGRDWDKEIKMKFDQADIVCFMVSPNFMRTTYIREHEIRRAFERKKSRPDSIRIIPIILDFCRWTTREDNLGDYTALPYTAKPVRDFANLNMAWYIIIECLRFMIETEADPTGDDYFRNNLPQDVKKIFERIVSGQADA